MAVYKNQPTKGRIFSGVQPTGNLHLGNYLGAIKNWVALQKDYECIFCAVDLHAITVPQDPAELKSNIYETVATYIACGIDAKECIIYPQSAVAGHTELAWILGCHTPLGWLNRMTQFKEKIQTEKASSKSQLEKIMASVDLSSQARLELDGLFTNAALKEIEKTDKAKLGLLSYPVLMAADILCFHATHVPVGEDQKQHLELTRDVAGAFNRQYDTEYFTLPEPLIMGAATRVMSLRDGTKKMSKSDDSDYSRIHLSDSADEITKKIKKAKSDAIDGISYDIDARPEASNLLTLYAALSDITIKHAEAEWNGSQWGPFKKALAELAAEKISPISKELKSLLSDKGELDRIIKEGTERALEISEKTMKEVKKQIGLYSF